MTPSVVTEKLDSAVSPWTERKALKTQVAMLKVRTLRPQFDPKFLEEELRTGHPLACMQISSNRTSISPMKAKTLPSEQYSLAMITGKDYFPSKYFETHLHPA